MRDGRFVARRPTGNADTPADGQPDGGARAGRSLPAQASDAAGGRARAAEGAGPDRARLVRRTRASRSVAGEILGFAGLVGAGRTELFEGLLGLRPASARSDRARGPGRCASATRGRRPTLGLTYLSEDRKGKGLHLRFGLAREPHADGPGALCAAAAAAAAGAGGPEDGRGANSASARGVTDVPARRCRAATSRSSRSPRCCIPTPSVVVLDEPTRGVDVGAKRDIYFLIQQAGRAKAARSS